MNRSQVLRQDDATLEFKRARVATVGQIYCATVTPKLSPVIGGSREGCRCIWKRVRKRSRREDNYECECFLCPGWIQNELVNVIFIERCLANPFNCDVILVVIQFATQPNSLS